MKTLREWRIERLLSHRALERESGVTAKTIVDIEFGRRVPHYKTIGSLSRALGVEPREVAEFAAAMDYRGEDAA